MAETALGANAQIKPGSEKQAIRSQRRQWIRAFTKQPRAVVGLAVLILLILTAIFAAWISPADPAIQTPQDSLLPPSLDHLFGTDELGRDVFSRVVFGSRISLQVGIVAVSIALIIGVPFGLIAGYWGGWVDGLIMRLIDALLAFPTLVLALAISAALGANLRNAMIAIGVVYVPTFARLIRVQVMALRNYEYVQAARASGANDLRILTFHVWPNVLPIVVIQASISIGFAVLAEASLSFLGLGAQPPTPAWGSMLKQGYPFMELAPWLAIFPGLAILIVVLSFNFIGDGIRAASDPRLRGRT